MSVYKGDKVTSVYKGDKLIASNMAAGTGTVTSQYIRDQNLLDMTNEASKYKLTAATSKDKAVQMPYDGILKIQIASDTYDTVFVLDKNKQRKYIMSYHAKDGRGNSGNIVFCKDDYLYFEYTEHITDIVLYFYKKRDYTGR